VFGCSYKGFYQVSDEIKLHPLNNMRDSLLKRKEE